MNALDARMKHRARLEKLIVHSQQKIDEANKFLRNASPEEAALLRISKGYYEADLMYAKGALEGTEV